MGRRRGAKSTFDCRVAHVFDDGLPPHEGRKLIEAVADGLDGMQVSERAIELGDESCRLCVMSDKLRDRMVSWLRKALREVR